MLGMSRRCWLPLVVELDKAHKCSLERCPYLELSSISSSHRLARTTATVATADTRGLSGVDNQHSCVGNEELFKGRRCEPEAGQGEEWANPPGCHPNLKTQNSELTHSNQETSN